MWRRLGIGSCCWRAKNPRSRLRDRGYGKEVDLPMTRFAVAFLACACAVTAADPLPKPETILDHYVEVTGGKAAYEKIHSEVVKGKMEVTGRGIAGSLVSYSAEPNRNYTL